MGHESDAKSGHIIAGLALIESCLHNEEYEDAEHYARHAMFMINDMTDNFIPSDQRPRFLADGSYYLAAAILSLAKAGGIPPEGKQKAGEEAIALARQALEIHAKLYGTESDRVAGDMVTLAEALGYFNDVDDNEIPRLFEQAIAIFNLLDGSSSVNVAAGEHNLGIAYIQRAERAQAANDVARYMANLELALPHFCEAVRIYKAVNRLDDANESHHNVAKIEEKLRQNRIAIAGATVAAAAATAAASTRG